MADRAVIPLPPENNAVACLTPAHSPIEKIQENGATSNRISQAANWYSTYERDGLKPVIPMIRDRFGLTNLEAITALKIGHDLKVGRAVNV